MKTDEQHIRSLELFRGLIKDGCEWHGDVMSRRWSECLYIPDDVVMERVLLTLTIYSDSDYRRDGYEVWIA